MFEGHAAMSEPAEQFQGDTEQTGGPLRPLDLSAALAQLPQSELKVMRDAGETVLNCQRVLRKTSSNVVGEVLRHQGTFYQWNHYPKGDAIDWETHSQYYYHAHPKDERPGEHGHFHTFLRYQGMPGGVEPQQVDPPQKANANRIGAHIVAVSCDKKGYASKLFTTNRWVTDETWYPAEQMVRMIDRFEIDHTFPSWATNIWLTGVIRLFRPQIRHLLEQRDLAVAAWQARFPDRDVFEDRELEITSELDVDVEAQMAALKPFLTAD